VADDLQIIDDPALARPSGYSNGMSARGRLLAIAGQVGWNADAEMVSAEFLPQFAQALRNVCTVVQAAGGTPEDIITLTIFVTDKQAYLDCVKPLGQAYQELMGRHYPAMTLVEVKGLIEPGGLVEIQGLAVLSETGGAA
jgi:enamine deaminase RidA (YjgF/YER057c/UK114 family)